MSRHKDDFAKDPQQQPQYKNQKEGLYKSHIKFTLKSMQTYKKYFFKE